MTIEFILYYSVAIISVIVTMVVMGFNRELRKSIKQKEMFKEAHRKAGRSAVRKAYSLLQEKREIEKKNNVLRHEVWHLKELVAMLQTQLAIADSLAKHTPENYPVTYDQHSM